MDPRQARTFETLRSAVLELASAKSIDEVSVTELAKAAGVTRETFYRHYSSPVDLLAAVLVHELDALLAGTAELPASTGSARSVFEQPERALLEHVAAHAEIYRNALSPHLTARLHDVLTESIQRRLVEHLRRHPQIAPDVLGRRPAERDLAMFAAFAASGTVGAIEAWLVSGDLDDTDAATHAILAASPEWWLGRN
jgi:AcrR family transcriptional regulator